MGIITTIPTSLNFPNRGVLERDDFVLAQETAQDLLAGAYTAALNQYATELNNTEADINLKWEQVQSQAVTGGYSQAYIDATFTPKILNTQTDKTTPVDADLIPLSDSASSFGLKKLSWANIKAALKTYFDTLYVALSGNQTIAGVKTFSSSPIVPTPSDTDNSTKISTTEWSKLGLAYSFGANGYLKIPNWMGGLIIQWGTTEASAAETTQSFPIAFPNTCFSVVTSWLYSTYTTNVSERYVKEKSNTSATFVTYSAGSGAVSWIAIGH